MDSNGGFHHQAEAAAEPSARAPQNFYHIPESCTHLLFGGCIQGGLKHNSNAKATGVATGNGAFNNTGGGEKRGGGGHHCPSGPPPQLVTSMSGPAAIGGVSAIRTIGGGSSVTSASPSSHSSSFMGRLVGASHAPITRQGYLYKKGKSGLKNWQKRWFVLEGSKLIW